MSELATSRKGMVTSPHRLASEAGVSVLRTGGNAIEAAIAMAAVVAVTCPHFCGLGGDAIWLVCDRTGHPTTLMGIGQAAEVLPRYQGSIPTRGPLSAITSAGAVESWQHAHDYSRVAWSGGQSLASLLDAAIGHAENGFPVTGSQVFWHGFRRNECADWRGFNELFAPQGRPPRQNETFAQPQLARSLKAIARHGAREFYEGELAWRIARGLAEAGAPVGANDLRRTATRREDPLRLDYRGLTLIAPPPPTQGATTLGIMGVLGAFDLASVPEGSTDFYHLVVEAVKQAFLDREVIADGDFARSTYDLLAPQNLAGKAASIDLKRALPWPQIFRTGDTVYLGATDADGRSVSMLQSIYYDWGSGVVAGDTGIVWQNRGAAFSLDPASPNCVAPGKRPFYTLNPGMALKHGHPHLLYGTQGADGQPQSLSVLLARLIDYGLDPKEALSRPRFLLGRTFSDSQDSLKLERDAGDLVLTTLAARGHEIAPIPAQSPLSGQAGVIFIHEDGRITGAHDPRSDGCALGA